MKRKLRIAAAKTQPILITGSMDRARPITLDIQGERVRPGEEVTYLGVRLRRRFGATSHLVYLKDRVILSLNGLSRIGGIFWGLRYPATMTIYKGLI